MILQRQQNRGSFIDRLEAKYAQPKPKKKKTKNT